MPRADGRRVRTISHFFKIIPFVMAHRHDSQNFIEIPLNYDRLLAYIHKKKSDGCNPSLMGIVIAAYVRTLAEKPELNRFVINRRIYARNHICVSFVVLKDGENETVAKLNFTGRETLNEVSGQVDEAITTNRVPANSNKTDRLVGRIFSMPLIPSAIVNFIKFLDRRGWLPRKIIEASPFHSSMFITNMASINMGSIYHHLYDFGTTSVFLALGKKQRVAQGDPDRVSFVQQIPMCVVTDERICSGYVYSKCFGVFKNYINNPELLETPPAEVKADIP